MAAKEIFFLLVQIEEAHTAAWPTGTITLGIPHANLEDRLARAQAFAASELPRCGNFAVVVDPWTNPFANRFRAWPDKYYLVDEARVVQTKSTYGAEADAVIDKDCVDVIYSL
jgi:hypothetical protein